MNVVDEHDCCSECDEAMMVVALLTLNLTAWSIFKLYNLQKTADYHSAIVYTCHLLFKFLRISHECPSYYWILLHFRFMNRFRTILIVLIKCSTISRSARGFMHLRVSRVDAGENTSYRLGEFDKTFSSIVGMVHHYTINRWVSGSASSFLIRTFHSNDVNIVRCLTSFL